MNHSEHDRRLPAAMETQPPPSGSRTVPPCPPPLATQWQDLALYVVVLLVCGLTLSKNQPDPDFWGHCQYGRELLSEGLPRTITHSYTTTDHAWINHEIVSELLLALGVDTFGATCLLGIKCLLGVGLVGLIAVRAARSGVAPLTLALVALLVAVNLMHFWLLRPQLLSYLYFAALLLLLTRSFRDWPLRLGRHHESAGSPLHLQQASGLESAIQQSRWLWFTPLLLGLWANSHGGFLAGYGVLAVYLCVRSAEARLVYGKAAWPLVGRFAAIVIASGLATLLNPYGIELHRWLFDALCYPRPEIIEWRPPELLHVAWLPWWLLVAVSVWSVWRGGRRIGFAELLVLLVVLWQAVEHRRNIPFFAIAFGIWLPGHVDCLLRRLRGSSACKGRSRSSVASPVWRARIAFAAGLTFAGILIVATLHKQLGTMPVMRSLYPVSAFEYMAERDLKGRLVLRFMWAQYAIAAFGDRAGSADATQVAFDGRFRTCYSQEIVDMYFDFALGNHPTEPRYRSPTSPSIDGGRILEYRNPDLVLLDRQQPHPVRLMNSKKSDWVLLYQDQLAQLWGRAARYADPQSSDYIPPVHRRISDEKQTGFVAWPAFPDRDPRPTLSANAYLYEQPHLCSVYFE